MDYDWRTWASSSENIHMAAYTGRGEEHLKMNISQILDAFVPSSQQLGLDQTRNWRGMWRQSRLYWLRTSWVTLNISRWFYLLRSFPDDFIYFEVFQKILFIWTLSDDFIYFEPFQMILYLLAPFQMVLFTLNPCRWWPSCRRSGSPSDPSRRKVEQATRDLDLEAGAVCTPLTCLHI